MSIFMYDQTTHFDPEDGGSIFLWNLECDRFLMSLQSVDMELRRNYFLPSVFPLYDFWRISGVFYHCIWDKWLIGVGEMYHLLKEAVIE